MRPTALALTLLSLATGGCVSTVTSVATLPFRAAGQAADWATTSQDEADRNYGRKMRKQQKEEAEARREYEKRCRRDPSRC